MSEETSYAEGWRPNPGDEISGKVIDISVGQGSYEPYPIVTLEDEGGTQMAVHAFHGVLQGELARRRPKIGDELKIRYLGKAEPKGNGNPYHNYRVQGGTEPPFNWAAFGGEPEQLSSAPPIAPAPTFASVGAPMQQASSAPAAAEDFSPLPPKPPAPQGEQFGDEPPF